MGCDIHIVTEYKDPYKDIWVNMDNWKVNHWYNPDPNEDEPEYEPEFIVNEWYIGRDYLLFGTLSAGVRVNVPYAFEPRGIPEDRDEKTQELYDRWGIDAHSANWLTYKEINQLAVKLTLKKTPAERPHPIIEFHDDFKQHIKSFMHYSHSYDKILTFKEECRIVFWFDN